MDVKAVLVRELLRHVDRHQASCGFGRDLMAESWPSLGGDFCCRLDSLLTVFGPFLARVHF